MGNKNLKSSNSNSENSVKRLVRPIAVGLMTMLCIAGMSAQSLGEVLMYNVSFSAHSFQIGSGILPAPTDPVVGSFTVSLDPALTYTANTSNISLNSLNIALGSALSFTYNPGVDGGFAAGTLRVGGSFNGPDVIQFSPSTNDFWLFIPGFTTTPSFQQLGYTQTSVSSNNLFFTLNQTGSVNVTQVPEPSSIGLVAANLVAGLFLRRRRI